MKKHIVPILLVLALLLSMSALAVMAAEAEPVEPAAEHACTNHYYNIWNENYKYEYDGDGRHIRYYKVYEMCPNCNEGNVYYYQASEECNPNPGVCFWCGHTN